jgi:hypothetical protein
MFFKLIGSLPQLNIYKILADMEKLVDRWRLDEEGINQADTPLRRGVVGIRSKPWLASLSPFHF